MNNNEVEKTYPQADESQSDFISRCISHMRHSGRTEDEAKGACYGIWENKKSLIKSAEDFMKCQTKKE